MDEAGKRFGPRVWFAGGNLLVASMTALVAFGVLPGGSSWIAVAAGVLITLLIAAAAALVFDLRRLDRLVRAAAVATLAAGFVLAAAATLGATFANAVSGVDAGPRRLLPIVVLAVVVPYFVLYPLGQLMWLARARAGRGPRA